MVCRKGEKMRKLKRIVALLCAISIVFAINITVNATTGLQLTVGNQTITQGEGSESVVIPVTLSGNTGVAAMLLSISYDEGLTLTSAIEGTALEKLTFTPGGDLTANPVKMLWDGAESDATNGVILNLTFNVPKAEIRDYEISVSYSTEDIIDADESNVTANVTSGTISVIKNTVSVTGVSLNKTAIVMNPGKTESLTEYIEPEDADNKAVEWSSSNENVATVTDGIVTAVSAGTATITVKTEDGGYTATCDVTVEVLGDIDGSGKVNINDAVLLFNHSMLPSIYSIEYKGNIDFDKSGTVNINDAVLLFNYSMLPSIYPIS